MKKAIGIYLGKSKSAMSISFRGINEVKIIRNKENEEFTPNFIGIRKNERQVGRTAYQYLKIDPTNTVHSIRKLIGHSIKDKSVQDMIESPYYKFGITALKGGTEDAVAVILGGKQYTPEQLCAEILKKLKRDAEEKLGDEVTHAVITVPAYFTEKQKNATRIAAQLAGLKVQKLLAEPTAAAIAFGVDNLKAGDAKTVLIYDFGGGTFDLSILNIIDGQYMEAGTGGDRWLGGDDLDRALQAHILKRISADYKIKNIDALIEKLDQRKRYQFDAQFRDNVENIKIQLSSSMSAQLIMDGFEDENGEWIDFDITIKREEFEKLAKPFVERSIELIENLLNEVGYDISMIDNILLVGEVSCIPLVKQMLSKKYGIIKVKIFDNPMLVKAEGAGILSHRLGDDCEDDIVFNYSNQELIYSTQQNYYIALENGNYDRIIEKGMPLPCKVVKTFRTTKRNQLLFQFPIYTKIENDRLEKQCIGYYLIQDELSIGTEITFEFKQDLDEIFEVYAYPKSNKSQRRKIVLARGNKDSKTLDYLASSIEIVEKGRHSRKGKEWFYNSIKKQMQKINRLITDNDDTDKWFEIYDEISEIYDNMKAFELQPYTVSNETLSLIDKADSSIKNDFYYRYAVQLLKEEEYLKAENIISTHLNFKSPDIEKLSDVLKAEKVNNALNQITQINQKIEQLYSNSLSTEELSTFYNSLESIVSSLKTVDLELSEKVLAIKPTLFNRLLTNFISIEQYGNAINLIQKYPKFWESPELLKNLGICCYGYASKGLLSEKNYKIVISGWLTSVYSDNVILKSLEDTTWDDNYTFSLAESIGSNYSQHEEVPENVNYDEISESNISIGATQRELLQRFETIIHKEITVPHLSTLVNDFYDKEKEGLEKVINILTSDILFPTPHFAISNDLNNEIIKELDSDYEEYSNEEALEAGVPYIKNSTSSIVYQYFFANDIIDRIKSAIAVENSETIKKLNTKENKGWIEKFDNISTTVEDSLFNTIANKISEDDVNEALIPVMEECIAFSSNNEKLKHQYSNYVANFCISKVNDNAIDNYKALTLMKGAYLRSPNNPRICKNFITLIRYNLMDMLNDRTNKTTDIYKILDWVKNNMSQTYKQNSSELMNARNDILSQLKSSGLDISLFEDKGFAPIRSGNSLNYQGLQMKKVLTYLRDLGSA
ncbi:MAG: Hsp70 family protein [Sphingobacteriia bacterium]